MKKCEVDPTHEIDRYGCIDCFFEACTEQSLIEMEKEENGKM